MNTRALLPPFPGLRFTNLTMEPDRVVFEATTSRRSTPCPLCHHRAHRVHSHHHRTLADLPWRCYRVFVQLTTRRFFCDQRSCRRRIFCERLPNVAAAWQRRTDHLRTALEQLALALGGRPGVRLGAALQLPASRMTLLRLIRALPLPSYDPPAAVGIDDWGATRSRIRSCEDSPQGGSHLEFCLQCPAGLNQVCPGQCSRIRVNRRPIGSPSFSMIWPLRRWLSHNRRRLQAGVSRA